VSKGRYEKYVNVTVRRELYKKLNRLADAKGFTVPGMISYLLSVYEDFIRYWESQRSLLGNLR